jgi:tRNA A37 threonylcarbamoyladenosine synthetase subunit TsaC/SUA5/YrdC
MINKTMLISLVHLLDCPQIKLIKIKTRNRNQAIIKILRSLVQQNYLLAQQNKQKLNIMDRLWHKFQQFMLKDLALY